MERGTVSMRVAFVLRSAEVQPLFRRFVRDSLWLYYNLHYIFHGLVRSTLPPPQSTHMHDA